MAKARALDKRRKSIRNIRKITRTMELIATARFKKAMDRAVEADAFTRKIAELAADLSASGAAVTHPLLEKRETKNSVLLILCSNRGLCGGYNGAIFRAAMVRNEELRRAYTHLEVEVAGKRGIAAAKFRKIPLTQSFTQFNDQPQFAEVDAIATRYLEAYATKKLDRLDVAYTKFLSSSKQVATVETLLPLGALEGTEAKEKGKERAGESMYEFLPSAESILQEVVPASFRAKLFKCFLDAAVSEKIARMVAMKSATENATDMIKELSSDYNRARQGQITGEIMEIIGGVEALKG